MRPWGDVGWLESYQLLLIIINPIGMRLVLGVKKLQFGVGERVVMWKQRDFLMA